MLMIKHGDLLYFFLILTWVLLKWVWILLIWVLGIGNGTNKVKIISIQIVSRH